MPSDWTEHFDSSDRVFYYNASTRVSSWTHPLEHVYRETYKTIVNLRNSTMSAQDRADALSKLQTEVRLMDEDTQKEVAKWSEHQDEQGNRFFFNKEERLSTWTDPRPAKMQVLYLKMKMLRILLSSTPGFVDNQSSRESNSRHGGVFGEKKEPKEKGLDYDTPLAKPRSEKKASAGDEIIDLSKDGDEKTSPRTSEPSAHSDSDSEERKKKKKKKKKEKKCKKMKEEKPTSSMSDMARPPTSSTANLALSEESGGFGEPGEVGKGHVKVKAGIKLEPLGGLQGGSSPSVMDRFDAAWKEKE